MKRTVLGFREDRIDVPLAQPHALQGLPQLQSVPLLLDVDPDRVEVIRAHNVQVFRRKDLVVAQDFSIGVVQPHVRCAGDEWGGVGWWWLRRGKLCG